MCADTLVPLLAALFYAMGRTGCTPAGFTDGLVNPFHKEGDEASIANYRPVTLLNTDTGCLQVFGLPLGAGAGGEHWP